MKRPVVDQEIIASAARRLTASIEGLRATEVTLLADAITEAYSYPMSRSKLARVLENEFGWDCDMFDSDSLSEMDSLVRDEHRKACKEWVADQDIKPKLEPGNKVLCLSKNLEGVIRSMAGDEAPGCYVIDVEDDSGSTRQVNVPFEDTIPI